MATQQLTSAWQTENFYRTQLSSDITASATDIFLDTVPVGSEGTLIIDPDSAAKREIIFYNSKTATKVTCPSAALGRGYDNTTATSHTAGATVIMAPISDWFNSLRTLFTTTPQGWTSVGAALSVSSGYNKGNKEYEINSDTDLTSVLSPGMRLKVNRGTTPPTQCADLESGSSQYASKSSPTGITFTDDYTAEAWIKLESYTLGIIVSRMSGANGFQFYLASTGQLTIYAGTGGVSRAFQSYQSVPLNQWVHVAASLDASGAAGAIYINGVSVPGSFITTSASSITQGGDLRVGANDSGNYVDGKISDVRIWSAIRTATQIRDNMNQQLVGNESNLVAYFKLDGNFNDSTSNANNLTASGGAAATNTDNPMNATEYAIVTKVATTTVTVFTGTDYNIPNMTLSTPHYSTQKAPFGFPGDRGKWRVSTGIKQQLSTTSNANWGSFASNGVSLAVPIGAWEVGYLLPIQSNTTTTVKFNLSPTSIVGVASGSEDIRYTIRCQSAAASAYFTSGYLKNAETITSQAIYILYSFGATTSVLLDADEQACEIFAECAYV